ncbi:hypothetical protein CC78DRAFT_460000 [Lojkania enalia]|uniref:Pentatricopeptide repeat protein n=1 Tax=Lojkania enalia TaxID=147567 RepID=A0A9P4KC69_9PLEO|nr:hypothetical protein CC78DRAFT_460000 [Didymosphaeria enalia]
MLLSIDARGFLEEASQLIWRHYCWFKRNDPIFPRLYMIPDRAWDIIWLSQSNRVGPDRIRGATLRVLWRDMALVGKSRTVGQRIEYLESLFYNGEEEQAMKEWEADYRRSDEESRHDYKPEHLELGARMYAFANRVDRAREIMEELFDLYPQWNPMIIMPVFRAHTRSISTQHHDVAHDLYVRMRTILGADVTKRDYDGWFVGFLEARHLQYSLEVFKDMFNAGYVVGDFSEEQVEGVLKRLHHLYKLGTNIEKMTNIALYTLSVLPQPYHSHIFGDWMKSAVITKSPEAGAQILDLMFRRGFEPRTFHFNILIKALLRAKDNQLEIKAENIGWQMVDKSTKTLPDNSRSYSAAEAITRRAPTPGDELSPTHDLVKSIPRANVTTYALLMQHHAQRFQSEHVDYLRRQMKEAEILPNTAVMNVLMDNCCRQGRYQEVWEIYKSLTDGPEDMKGVFPDGSSVRCLWKTLRLALGDHLTRENSTLPSPRQLLAETIDWWNLVRSRYDSKRFKIGFAGADHKAISTLIMHCFSYTKDLPGSLVSMHVLGKRFGIYPSDKAISILQRHIAWTDMQNESKSVRAQFARSGVHKHNLEKMARIYNILRQNRFARTNMTGDHWATLSERDVGNFNLDMFSEFVRVVLKRQYRPEEVELLIDEAKKDIGLPELTTGDLDAFNVV